MIDCLGDGNSGQGDDKKHGCEFPPGCDDQGCCDEDVLEPDDEGDSDEDSEDPPAEDPPADEPPSDDPVCELSCETAKDCGAEQVCVGGCCSILTE